MSRDAQRLIFGAAAFALCALTIAAVLSPLVAADKEKIALIVLGNVLSWPMMVMAFHYGTSAGSQRKTDLLAQASPIDGASGGDSA